MDCVRANNTSLHSYDRETTPFLEQFGESATVFEQAKAPAPKSLTSHVSMFTGMHVEEHNVTNRDWRLQSGETIWEDLATEKGYSTGVFSGNTFLTKLDVGLKSSFDHVYSGPELPFESGLNPAEYIEDGAIQYVDFLVDSIKDRSPFRSFLNGIAKVRSDRDGQQFADAFLEWKNDQKRPWAGVINFMDAHTKYDPPSKSNKWADSDARSLMNEIGNVVWEYQCGHRPASELGQLEDLYDGCIHYVDRQISRLIGELDDAGELDDTLVIITADHGEGFGEKSRVRPETRLVGHGESKIHEVVLHVPLVVKYPGQESSVRVSEPVSLTYLPTLIRSAIENPDSRKEFVSAEPVLATAVGLEDVDEGSGRAGRFCDDLSMYTGYARALYQEDNGPVRKFMSWESNTATLDIHDHSNTQSIAASEVRETIQCEFQEMDARDVARRNDDEIDAVVKQRLEELGYA